MSDFIEVKDPRGVKIYCTKSQWNQHIVSEETGHPMMADNVDAVVATISKPDYIYESHDSDPPLDYREVFSKRVESATYYSSSIPFTKVVVSVVGGSGEIITAYPARNATGGTIGEAIYCADNEI